MRSSDFGGEDSGADSCGVPLSRDFKSIMITTPFYDERERNAPALFVCYFNRISMPRIKLTNADRQITIMQTLISVTIVRSFMTRSY